MVVYHLLFSKAIDSENNEGSIGFSSDQKTIFFTQENPNNKELFTLHTATLNEDDAKKWTNITNLNIVPEKYSAETPSISPDGKKIYLASNIPGGFGGFDIYEATVAENGTVSNLVNLGPSVNTSEDEKYPYMSSDNKYLYFSSKGHLNLGGYDVFRSANVNNSFLTAMNLGTDLNSRRVDIAFVMTSPSNGYISTDKNQSGNFDILKFEIRRPENVSLNYIVVEEITKTPLPDATVTVTDEFGNRLTETQSDNKGKIKLTFYNVEVMKDGYENKSCNWQYLVKKGINATQLSYKGYGKKELFEKCDKCSALQNQINRRIEYKILN